MSKLTRALAELAKRADAGDQAARQAIRPTKKTIDDFSNEDSFYRIVDEDAYIDLVNSGAVRTNFGNKPGSTINDKLASRPTRYPSFSKGSANKTYAEGKPNHYIIETKDPSIKPSTEGRHGKGTTQFPTDSTGVHLESLPGEAVQVYRHIGDGQYRLVYDQGKVTPKATNAETNVAAPLGNISVPIAAAIAAGTMTPEEAQAGPGQRRLRSWLSVLMLVMRLRVKVSGRITVRRMISRLSASLRCLTVLLCISQWMTRCPKVPG
jgi:hypothetical protein